MRSKTIKNQNRNAEKNKSKKKRKECWGDYKNNRLSLLLKEGKYEKKLNRAG